MLDLAEKHGTDVSLARTEPVRDLTTQLWQEAVQVCAPFLHPEEDRNNKLGMTSIFADSGSLASLAGTQPTLGRILSRLLAMYVDRGAAQPGVGARATALHVRPRGVGRDDEYVQSGE